MRLAMSMGEGGAKGFDDPLAQLNLKFTRLFYISLYYLDFHSINLSFFFPYLARIAVDRYFHFTSYNV